VTVFGGFVVSWEFREFQNSGNWCAWRDNFPIDVDPIGEISYRCREDCVLFSALVQYIMGWRCHASGFGLLSGIPGIVICFPISEGKVTTMSNSDYITYRSMKRFRGAEEIDPMPLSEPTGEERDQVFAEIAMIKQSIDAAMMLVNGVHPRTRSSLHLLLASELKARERIEVGQLAFRNDLRKMMTNNDMVVYEFAGFEL